MTYQYSAHPEEQHLLADLANLSDSRYILEIGSCEGGTAIALADQCPRKIIWCVDPWDAVQDGSETEFQRFLASTEQLRAANRICYVRQKSLDAIPFLPPRLRENVALVFVDGLHTYPWPRIDLTLYTPFCSPDGRVAMHDYFDPMWGHDAQKSLHEYALDHGLARVNFFNRKPDGKPPCGLAWFKKSDVARP